MALYRSVKESNEQCALDMEPLFEIEVAAIDQKLNPDLVTQAEQMGLTETGRLIWGGRKSVRRAVSQSKAERPARSERSRPGCCGHRVCLACRRWSSVPALVESGRLSHILE